MKALAHRLFPRDDIHEALVSLWVVIAGFAGFAIFLGAMLLHYVRK